MEENLGAFEETKDKMPAQQGDAEIVGEAAAESAGGKRLKKSGNKGRRAVGFLIGMLAAVYLSLCAWAHFDTGIAPNTYFAGINYGGLSRREAEIKLADCLEKARSTQLDFVAVDDESDGPVASVALGEIDIDVDVQSIVGTMLAKPYHGFFAGGAYYMSALLFDGTEVGDCSYDEAFRAAAEPVLSALECEITEFHAGVTESGEVRVTKARDGREVVDRERTELAVVTALRKAYFGGGYSPRAWLYDTTSDVEGEYEILPAQEVDLAAEREKLLSEKVNASCDIESEQILPSRTGVSFSLASLEAAYAAAVPGETFTLADAVVTEPEVTTEELEACLFRDELSSYTTRVSGAVGRHKNVQLTAERINGYIMNAGETMKYSPLVAPFSAANGYSPAPGYLNGKTVDMVGGGACQASSTLYAAALYANLEIVQRVNHGYASSYIGLGLDATVAEGGPEFEIRNNTLYPIKVCAEFFTQKGKDYIKVTLLGTKTDDSYVKIVTELLSTTPYGEEIIESEELAPGETREEQTPYTGYQVKTYRNVYAGDGTLISSAYEATSNYKMRNRITLVGKAPTVELPADQPTEQPAEVPTEQPTEPPAEAPAEQPTETPGGDVPQDGSGTTDTGATELPDAPVTDGTEPGTLDGSGEP